MRNVFLNFYFKNYQKNLNEKSYYNNISIMEYLLFDKEINMAKSYSSTKIH